MFVLEEDRKTTHIRELLEQVEESFSELRLEFIEITRSFDDAMDRIEELEADRIYYEELLEECTRKGRQL